jgi:predicted translin family RNA/ssDNA-binding protein
MAVIAYWRPFSKTKGLPFLSFKQLGIKPTSEQQALHDRIGDLRNKVVAHTDADHVRVAYQTADMLDGIMMPHMEFYEGIDLYDDRFRWMEWLRALSHAGAKKLFAEAQGKDAISLVRDNGPI